MSDSNLLIGLTTLYALFFVVILIYMLHRYMKERNKIYVSMLWAIVFFTAWAILLCVSFIFASELIFRFNNLNFALGMFFFIIYVDLIRNDAVNIWRTSFGFGMIIIIFLLLWFPDSVQMIDMGGYSVPFWNGWNLIFSYIMLFQSLIYVFMCFLTILQHITLEKKKIANLIMTGVYIFVFGTVITSFFKNILWMEIISGVGGLIIMLGVRIEPQILYILPFTVHRISVIEKGSGLNLYDYAWTKGTIDKDLIGGLLQGLQHLSVEVLKSGEIEEIKLKTGTLLFHSTELTMTGLFSSSTSMYLRECFKKFIQTFENQFKECLINHECNVEAFSPATELIKRIFSNIPTR